MKKLGKALLALFLASCLMAVIVLLTMSVLWTKGLSLLVILTIAFAVVIYHGFQ